MSSIFLLALQKCNNTTIIQTENQQETNYQILVCFSI